METAESAQQPQTSTRESVQVGLHYLTFGADDALLNQVGDTDDSGNAYVEILFPGDTAKLILAEPPPDGSTARLRVYLAPLKTAVVERDTDLLTDAEYYKFAGEVSAAILEELRIWIVHQCFTRRPRKGARNVLDVRWVGKWKWVKSKIDPSKKVRIIRMRMTLRGFKDVDAADLITFAGTSSRVSQRIVVSEACCRGWPLAAIDVKKAFLKGITYAELAATTNEPAREVNFELSPDAVAILRQCPGFENFDPTREVLHNTKPGTGCKDAPRCFGIKFTRATNDEFGAKSTTHDEKFIVRHTEGKLDFLGAKHVDDVKAGCPPDILKEFISKLEKVLGKGELDITLHNFTCCGVRHSLTDKSYEMDQIEYVNALKPIENKEMVGKSNDQPADPYNAQLFLSLLMALAFSLLTRVDLGAYVVALQRIAQSPKCLHIRRLNALVRWAQRNPLKLVYHFMTCAGQLMCDSDTGYRREVDEEGNTDGRAARGANYMRIGTSGNERVVHLIDWLVGSVKQVVRSTFTAETHGVIGTVDNAIVLSSALHEIKHGPLSTTIAKQLADYGGADFEVEVVTDARNLLLALGSARLKPPAERSFIVHLLWLREKILRGVIRRLTWCDTRDMTSDGHTKGSVSRDAIRKLAAGRLQRQFATESLTADDIPHAVTQVSEPAALGGHGGSLATLMTTKVTQDRNYQKPYSSSPISLCMVVTSTCSVPDDDARLRVTPDAPELNPFELLGCSNLTFRDALQKTPSDWAKIWRKASVTLHPDKFDLQGVTWEHANRRFQTATAAKDVLVKDESDIAARAQQFELISKFLSHQALPSSSAASSSADCPMPSSAARRLTPGEHFAQTVVLQSLFQRTRCNKTRSQGGDLPEGAIVAGQAEHEKAVAEYKRANSLKQPAARFPVGPEKRDERAALAKDSQHEKIQRKLTRVQRSHPARKSLVRLRRAAKDWTRAAEFNQAVAREGAQRRAEIEGKSTTSVDVRQAWRKYRRGQEEWEPPPDPKYRHYRGSKQKAKDRRFSKARKALKRATQGPAPMLTDGTVHLDAEDDGRLAAVPAATPGEKRKRKRKRTQQSSLGAAEEDWEQIDVESDWEQITVEAAPATQLMKPKSKATAGPKAVTPASVPRLLQPTSKVAARPRVYPVAPWRRR